MDTSSTMPFVKDADYVQFVNEQLNQFVNEHRVSHVPLGPDFKLFDHELATEALQLHRLVKKFEIPDDELSSSRADASVDAMLADDSRGLTHFQPGNMDLCGSVRHTLYNARILLHEAVANYRFSVSNLELTSGETYVSARGDTSVYAKLNDAKQWCVTTHCKARAFQLIYNSPMLRSAAKRLYLRWFTTVVDHSIKVMEKSSFFGPPLQGGNKVDREYIFTNMWNAVHDKMWSEVQNSHPHANRAKLKWLVFTKKLEKIITVVPGSRLTTVPKDNSVDRVILCEPWLDMLVERTIAMSIRKLIKQFFGIDLQTSQTLHGLMISDLQNATIDWKNASNSNYWAQVEWFLKGTPLYHDINAGRNRLVVYNQQWSRLNMVSPNGNGFTFELMTLILLTVGRVLDSFCHVYGDDVIIDRDVAAVYISTVESLGYSLNNGKTFVDGNFRESCGSFFCDGYITSYDLHYAEDIVDAIIVTNKVGIMAHATHTPLRDHWLKLHRNMLSLAPRNLLRAFRLWSYLKTPKDVKIHIQDLADGILCHPRFLANVYKSDPVLMTRHKNFIIDHLDRLLDLNISPSRAHAYRYVTKRSISYADTDSSWYNLDDIEINRGWFYIWSGKCTAPTIRETRLSSEYRISIR